MRFIVLLFAIMGFTTCAYAVEKNVPMSAPIQVKGQTPEGVTIQKNKVLLKKGYVLEKKSNTKVISRMRGGNGITGEFDCTCNGEQGGCSAVTTPNSVTCVSSGCNSCYMIVTIPDKVNSRLSR